MKKLRLSGQFRKDFKKYRNNKQKLEILNAILLKLQKGEPIPPKNKPHILVGQYHGCMECHIGPDFLLIWVDETNDTVYLVRLGSHSELFG